MKYELRKSVLAVCLAWFVVMALLIQAEATAADPTDYPSHNLRRTLDASVIRKASTLGTERQHGQNRHTLKHARGHFHPVFSSSQADSLSATPSDVTKLMPVKDPPGKTKKRGTPRGVSSG